MRAASFSCVGRYASLVPHGNSSFLFILSLQRFWAVFALFGLSVFVVFCRICSHKTDKAVAYNRGMEIIDKYIPREYLALKINYCRWMLEHLPMVKVRERMLDGTLKKRLIVGNQRYSPDSQAGIDLYTKMELREAVERELAVYEAIWNLYFRDSIPEMEPMKTVRTLYTGSDTPVIMNKEYFDSLNNDANKNYPKPVFYPFNGTYYRSEVERSIAILYTDLDIPFKYEPEVKLSGLRKPIYPDFVPYFKEIDSCKFHEHFGIMGSSDYIRDSKIKFGNYTNAGLLQDLDFYFTYSSSDSVLDARFLQAKINTMIFGSMTCCVEKSPFII